MSRASSNTSLRTPYPSDIKKLNGRQIQHLRELVPVVKIVKRMGGFAIGAWETVRTGSETYEELPIVMTANQVRAGIALLNKVMPDLQSVQMEVTDDRKEMSTDQLRHELRHVLLSVKGVVDVEARPALDDLLQLDLIDNLLGL